MAPLAFRFRFNFGYYSVGQEEDKEEEGHIYPGHKAKYLKSLAVRTVADDADNVFANTCYCCYTYLARRLVFGWPTQKPVSTSPWVIVSKICSGKWWFVFG